MTPVNPARPLNTERWLRIESIFHQARSQGEGAREEALRHLCGGDEELLAEVRALLGADTEANRPRAAKETRMADLAGRRAGNYQLDSLLGTGGMGSVYLAHRSDGQFNRQVACKILGANLRSEFFTERFAVERQLLATLDHPHITRLLDSGVSGEGDPYLVLEYVDGEPIDEYCDERRLGLRDRIRLFLQVCTAVEFAHSQRVLHRDPGSLPIQAGGARIAWESSGGESSGRERRHGEAAGLRHCETVGDGIRHQRYGDAVPHDDAALRESGAVARRSANARHGCLFAGNRPLRSCRREPGRSFEIRSRLFPDSSEPSARWSRGIREP